MQENCCENRPNFGRPVCVDEFGSITTLLFVPYNINMQWNIDTLTYEDIWSDFFITDKNQRIYGFPQLENVTYGVADSLKEEGASGRKSFLRDGIISITAETWDKDGSSVLKGKMSKIRCADWGVFIVTDKNLIIGIEKSSVDAFGAKTNVLLPIKIDPQSVDPKFMFKTNTTTQKIMLTLDLDRNIDDSKYYAISGDALWSSANSQVQSIDFNDVPKVVDTDLTLNGAVLNTATTTTFNIVVNDDFRQGARNVNNTDIGNVVGLDLANFTVKNLTTNLNAVITSVTEQSDGNYAFVIPLQEAASKLKVDLIPVDTTSISYNGTITIKN